MLSEVADLLAEAHRCIGAHDASGVRIPSPAFDAVCGANHPSPEQGGPCATCAFRPDTEASRSAHTVALARLSIEGLQLFMCHDVPGLCKGWTAAVNLRGEQPNQAAAYAAAILSDAIRAGKDADDAR